jgi:hypothetical protein
VLPQASSSKSKFETEIDHKNTQLKHFRDEVEEMMVAIEVIHGRMGMRVKQTQGGCVTMSHIKLLPHASVVSDV